MLIETISCPQPNRHLLEKMCDGKNRQRQTGKRRRELCAELRGEVFGCEFRGAEEFGEDEGECLGV